MCGNYRMTVSSTSTIRTLLLLIAAALAFPLPSGAAGEDQEGKMLGILTVPAVDEGIIYFAGFGDKLYAFDEVKNEERWVAAIEPASEYALDALPAPAPTSSGSYVLFHLGRRLWAVSRVDGRVVWSVDSLPEASMKSATRTSNPMPGYAVRGDELSGWVFSLEEDSGFWFCRKRRLGDGGIVWENKLEGNPRAWWSDYSGLWIACEQYGPEGAGESGTHAGLLTRVDPDSGSQVWASPVDPGMSFRAALRSFGRMMLLEKKPDGQFQLRAFREDTGELYRTISYSRGDFLWALESSGRLILLHRKSRDELTLDLYYASLNLIKSADIQPAGDDQPFAVPEVDNTLLLYAGTAFSLYDGNRVWQFMSDSQKPIVAWTSDSERLYLWDSSGSLDCLERITGLEVWRTPFSVLPPPDVLGPGYGGASLTLDGNRLLAATPGGELFRIDTIRGEPNPGVIRIPASLTDNEIQQNTQPEQKNQQKKSPTALWTVLILALVIFAVGLYVNARSRGASNEPDSDDWPKR